MLNTVGEGSGPLKRANMLYLKGHDVTVCCFMGTRKGMATSQVASEMRHLKKKYSVPIRFVGSKKLYSIAGFFELYNFIRKNKYDIVFCHHNVMGTVGSFISVLAGTPSIVKVQLSDLNRRSRLFKLLDFIAFFIVKKIICISKSTSDSFGKLENRLFESKKTIIHNGINFADIPKNGNNPRARIGIDKNTIVISTIGRLHPVKNQKFLIDAFRLFVKKNMNAKLIIVGRGQMENELRSLVNHHKIADNVIFTGYLKLEDVYEVLFLTDIYAMTSHSEGFSESLVQAMACGKPSVVVDIPSFKEAITDGRDGLIADRDDANEFAAKLEFLSSSPHLRNKYGQMARDKAEKMYNMDTISSKYEIVIKHLGKPETKTF